jgi:hypothetical protein
MRYEQIPPLSIEVLQQMFASQKPADRMQALLSAALNSDCRWAEEQCTLHLSDTDSDVRATAAISLAHIARSHGLHDVEGVVARLADLMKDASISGRVGDAIDDIESFERKRRRGET